MVEPKYTLQWVNPRGEIISRSYHMDLNEVNERIEEAKELAYYKYLTPKIKTNEQEKRS